MTTPTSSMRSQSATGSRPTGSAKNRGSPRLDRRDRATTPAALLPNAPDAPSPGRPSLRSQQDQTRGLRLSDTDRSTGAA